ncbi:hypothetical protein [Chelatococcus reniformis]|uniref:Lipoprotein n=1 Tax=Chelatococcus reniformis TaxID=1494448 RepID=A0A916XNU4_9HYPH|nr:hypothetical protein [Chelatococcus reniformis]GGC90869.1 hypothetical protein GCM10010994_55830 [Chelatococcus reniformis]
MKISPLPLAALLLLAVAGGCTTSGDGTVPKPAPAAADAEPDSDPGPGVCGEQIAAFRRVLKQDISMGFLGKDVLAAVTPKVERAAEACRAGKDAEAQRLLANAKKRHGYR